jgi:hypothetical protein
VVQVRWDRRTRGDAIVVMFFAADLRAASGDRLVFLELTGEDRHRIRTYYVQAAVLRFRTYSSTLDRTISIYLHICSR